MVMRLAGLILAFLLLVARPAAAQGVVPLIERHGFAADEVALLVETLGGQVVAEHRADAPGLPASTLKLITALGALDRLGPEHRFATRLMTSGTVGGDGTLVGDVILVGGGDPLLDLDGLMHLAWALRGEGVRRLDGRLIVDDRALPLLPFVNAQQPIDAGYNAGIGALSLAFNRAERLPLAGGRSLTLPPLVERGPAWRRLPADRPAVVPVQDPGMHAARVFRHLADALGIDLPEPVRLPPAEGVRLVAEVESRPLRDLVQAMLLYSNNQVAEIVGLAATGEATLAASAAAMVTPIRRELPAIDWVGFAMTNHSGLDGQARATPRQLMAVLRLAEQRHDVIALLPAAGWSGSLASRFREEDTALRIWAKTGSLDFASALVGYVLPAAGEPLRVALLITDPAGRRQRDAVEVPTAAMRRAIDDFTLRARDLRDALAGMLVRQPG